MTAFQAIAEVFAESGEAAFLQCINNTILFEGSTRMTDEQKNADAGTSTRSEFRDSLAPHHATIENHYLGVSATCRLMADLREPMLVVGAGHDLVVAEIQKAGLQCDGKRTK